MCDCRAANHTKMRALAVVLLLAVAVRGREHWMSDDWVANTPTTNYLESSFVHDCGIEWTARDGKLPSTDVRSRFYVHGHDIARAQHAARAACYADAQCGGWTITKQFTGPTSQPNSIHVIRIKLYAASVREPSAMEAHGYLIFNDIFETSSSTYAGVFSGSINRIVPAHRTCYAAYANSEVSLNAYETHYGLLGSDVTDDWGRFGHMLRAWPHDDCQMTPQLMTGHTQCRHSYCPTANYVPTASITSSTPEADCPKSQFLDGKCYPAWDAEKDSTEAALRIAAIESRTPCNGGLCTYSPDMTRTRADGTPWSSHKIRGLMPVEFPFGYCQCPIGVDFAISTQDRVMDEFEDMACEYPLHADADRGCTKDGVCSGGTNRCLLKSPASTGGERVGSMPLSDDSKYFECHCSDPSYTKKSQCSMNECGTCKGTCYLDNDHLTLEQTLEPQVIEALRVIGGVIDRDDPNKRLCYCKREDSGLMPRYGATESCAKEDDGSRCRYPLSESNPSHCCFTTDKLKYTECSGHGLCKSTSEERWCECDEGWWGNVCQLMKAEGLERCLEEDASGRVISSHPVVDGQCPATMRHTKGCQTGTRAQLHAQIEARTGTYASLDKLKAFCICHHPSKSVSYTGSEVDNVESFEDPMAISSGRLCEFHSTTYCNTPTGAPGVLSFTGAIGKDSTPHCECASGYRANPQCVQKKCPAYEGEECGADSFVGSHLTCKADTCQCTCEPIAGGKFECSSSGLWLDDEIRKDELMLVATEDRSCRPVCGAGCTLTVVGPKQVACVLSVDGVTSSEIREGACYAAPVCGLGTLVDNACECPESRTGPTCDECKFPYYGLDCEFKCTEETCGDRGKCDEMRHVSKGHSQPPCTCDTFWYGHVCDEVCLPDDCNGHGTCVRVTGSPRCTCDLGWKEDANCIECAVDYFPANVCDRTCQPVHGKCVDNLPVCDYPWMGEKCDVRCACSSLETETQGIGGSCGAGESECKCDIEWAGEHCDTCADGWGGHDCGTPLCIHTCKNNATCACTETSCKCNCPEWATGDDCGTVPCDPPCPADDPLRACNTKTGWCDCTPDDGDYSKCQDWEPRLATDDSEVPMMMRPKPSEQAYIDSGMSGGVLAAIITSGVVVVGGGIGIVAWVISKNAASAASAASAIATGEFIVDYHLD
jgi:hypothetical protein